MSRAATPASVSTRTSRAPTPPPRLGSSASVVLTPQVPFASSLASTPRLPSAVPSPALNQPLSPQGVIPRLLNSGLGHLTRVQRVDSRQASTPGLLSPPLPVASPQPSNPSELTFQLCVNPQNNQYIEEYISRFHSALTEVFEGSDLVRANTYRHMLIFALHSYDQTIANLHQQNPAFTFDF